MEWGPWIEHDGKGIKPYGAGVHAQVKYGTDKGHVMGVIDAVSEIPSGRTKGWHWSEDYPEYLIVIRYRIRKPLGLAILETILNELPKPVKQKELTE